MSAIASTRPGGAILTPSDDALMLSDYHSQTPFATQSIDATTLRAHRPGDNERQPYRTPE